MRNEHIRLVVHKEISLENIGKGISVEDINYFVKVVDYVTNGG